MESFYKLYESMNSYKKRKLLIESVMSEKLKSLSDALEFIGLEGNVNLSRLANQTLSDKDWEIVKNAHRNAVKKWHPDRAAKDPETQQNAKDYTIAINFAFEKLNKAFQEKSPLSSSEFSPSGGGREHHPWHDSTNITLPELKQKMEKKLKESFPNVDFSLSLKDKIIETEFIVDSKAYPAAYEEVSVGSNFEPIFQIYIRSNISEWEAKVILLNKVNNQKLLEKDFKQKVYEATGTAMDMFTSYYEEFSQIPSFIFKTLQSTVKRKSPIELMEKAIKRTYSVRSIGNSLIWDIDDETHRKNASQEDWFPQTEDKVSVNNRFSSGSTFSPVVMTATMTFQDNSIKLSISDNVLYKVTKVISISNDKSSNDPWSGQSYNLNSENWASTFLMNIPRQIISDFKKLYEKHSIEKRAEHTYPGRTKPRGLDSDGKKRIEELSSKISSSVEKLAA